LSTLTLFSEYCVCHLSLPSFPTRRSSDLEYMHIVNTAEKRWLQQRLETVRSHPQFDRDVKKHLLERVTAAEGLEKYLGAKYPGRSEEHTSELQSRENLVCRLLLEKKNKTT